ncbi:MAG: arylformamidase [Thermoleophilaceae bacterium]|jgi:kynurenine formamidase|nr:arylformamidase [Thermoleophilaceae bacterium]
MDIIDLSLPLTSGMPHYPGAAPVYLAEGQRFEDGGFRTSLVALGSHSGTHLDAPSHFLRDGSGIGEIALERCVGEAQVLDLSAKGAGEPITIDDLAQFEGAVTAGARLLLRTDWDEQFGREEYFTDYPPLAPEAAAWLAEQGIFLLGLDIPSVHPTAYAEMHVALLSASVVIVESLAKLRFLLSPRVFLCAAPLNLVESDGSPVRAFALEGMPPNG